jgi:hypothetical protein
MKEIPYFVTNRLMKELRAVPQTASNFMHATDAVLVV